MNKDIKTIKCFGPLSVENNDLCPDTTIYIHTQKNGKCNVKIFDGIAPKPYISKKFENSDITNKYVEEFISNGNYKKIVR